MSYREIGEKLGVTKQYLSFICKPLNLINLITRSFMHIDFPISKRKTSPPDANLSA